MARERVVEEDVADDVWVAERAQDLELGGDALELGGRDLGVEVDLLDRDDALQVVVDEQADVDRSEAALADLGAAAQIGAAVGLVVGRRSGFLFLILFFFFLIFIIFFIVNMLRRSWFFSCFLCFTSSSSSSRIIFLLLLLFSNIIIIVIVIVVIIF
jgi:hypothetical protein